VSAGKNKVPIFCPDYKKWHVSEYGAALLHVKAEVPPYEAHRDDYTQPGGAVPAYDAKTAAPVFSFELLQQLLDEGKPIPFSTPEEHAAFGSLASAKVPSTEVGTTFSFDGATRPLFSFGSSPATGSGFSLGGATGSGFSFGSSTLPAFSFGDAKAVVSAFPDSRTARDEGRSLFNFGAARAERPLFNFGKPALPLPVEDPVPAEPAADGPSVKELCTQTIEKEGKRLEACRVAAEAMVVERKRIEAEVADARSKIREAQARLDKENVKLQAETRRKRQALIRSAAGSVAERQQAKLEEEAVVQGYGTDKPVLYLYSDTPLAVHVEVALQGKAHFGSVYPRFDTATPQQGQWNVRLRDGHMKCQRQIPYLYWDTKANNASTMQSLVRGPASRVLAKVDVEARTRDAIQRAGLQGKEMDDFLLYWLPRLTAFAAVRVCFLTHKEVHTHLERVTITPTPVASLLVFMLFEPTNDALSWDGALPVPTPEKRAGGLVAVEWGGACCV
ncbi:Hypothetical protein POVN_LOCUS208, partial [uncultured virus]